MSLVTVTEVKAIGRIDYDTADTELQMLIDGAESFVEEHCCIKLSTTSVVDERVDGGNRQLWPRKLPITAVTEVKDAWNEDEAIDTSFYFFDETRIIADEEEEWDDGEQRFKVTYTAGYTAATAPNGLKSLIIGLTLMAYDNPQGLGRRGAKGFGVSFDQLAKDNNLIYQLDHFSLRRYVE